jgi:phosphomannomutase/phosphoglucomutase
MNELIITPSGVRGVVGESLTRDSALELAKAFGSWAKTKVIIGRDTRKSGPMLEQAVIEGLTSQGCDVVNTGVMPTPVIIHSKNKLGIKAGIIISGSHNPPEWNALKLMSEISFTSQEEIEEIKKEIGKEGSSKGEVISHDPLEDYVNDLLTHVKTRNCKIKVALDTGAGAGKIVTPLILERLGCEVTLVNNEFINNEFPRDPEPVEKNLGKLIDLMKQGRHDIGFAHDCDADRLAVINEQGELYQEDAGLALITKHEGRGTFVTNSASSLVFEAIMGKENVIRTPVGERHLAVKMSELPGKVFGGEGSCGGVMFPKFNNCRDGIFGAAKIVEILARTGKKISELVGELPRFYSERRILKDINIEETMNQLKKKLEDYEVIDNDVKVSGEDWFVIAHPSNTEPIIRIISEARTKEKAEELVEWMSNESLG